MSISEVLLFVTTNSKACVGCLDFITRYNFPAQVVRLDSEEARSIASKGSYFQVTAVPTMVVIYEDGNTQLFLGAPKITQWMTMIMSKPKKPSESQERGVTSYLPAGGNMYGPRPNPPRPARQEIYMPERRPEPTRILVEEDEPEEEEVSEEEPILQPPPKPKKPRKPSSKPAEPPKKKKKKKPPVRFEEEDEPEQKEVEVEYIEEPSPPPPPKRPKDKQAQSRMAGIYNTAKQMEQDRKNSLGYREEDLPHY